LRSHHPAARLSGRAFLRSGEASHDMKKYPLFVFLLAIYPSLALLTWNFREVDAYVVVRPLLFSISFALILIAISFLFVKNWPKAILVSTVFIIFFFSFGHISLLLEGSAFAAALGGLSRFVTIFLFAIALLTIIFLCRVILRSKKDLTAIYQVLNIISLFLVVSTGFMLMNRYFSGKAGSPVQQSTAPGETAAGPDVYYIILDAYGRQDSLKTLGYDNAAFVSALEDIGFYVASCSRSNYPQTVVSMASALNMGYLWDVIPNQGSDDRNSKPVYAGILHGQVRQVLENRGYRIIAFDSGADWLNWRDADQFVAPPPRSLLSTQLDPFEYIFLDTTALHPLMTQPFFLQKKYVHNYDRILFALKELPKIAQSEGAKFVYVHMLIPHRPNIFLPDGSMNLNTDYYKKGVGEGINRQYDIEGYINNTKFVNSRLPNVVREILANSKTPPVIIIQADHGYQLPAIRFDILNAYFFPNQNYAALYPEISPVNTFRVVFNTYFAGNYPLLKDQSIDIGINRPYGKKVMKPGECP
jgi:hypothetical protein